jgi:putative transposase
VKYAFIVKHRDIWLIRWLCAALAVSASGFYEWLSHAESAQAKANRELLVAIRASFNESGQAYGSPRVWRDVRAWGHQTGEHRVARLMRKFKLVARPKRRRWPKDGGVRPSHALAPNTLERRFEALAPNAVNNRGCYLTL